MKILYDGGFGKLSNNSMTRPIIYRLADSILNFTKPIDGFYEIQGFKIKKGRTTRRLFLTGDYEPAISSIIKNEVKEGMIAMDLGANLGWHTLHMSKLVGNVGKVFSFEPDPYNFKVLTENVQANHLTNVSAHNLAVSDRNGKTKLSLIKDQDGSNFIDSDLSDNFIETDTVTLDNFFKDKKVIPDFIKMDIEGAEPKAFAGMLQIVKKNSNLKIISEFFPDALKRMKVDIKLYLNLLTDQGFTIYRIDESVPGGKYTDITIDELLNLQERSINLYCIKEKN